jgi:hypothetical protein
VADIGNMTGKIDVGRNDMNHLPREDAVSYGDYDYYNDNNCNSNDFQPTDATLKIITTQSDE